MKAKVWRCVSCQLDEPCYFVSLKKPESCPADRDAKSAEWELIE
jgi:hypothetical protein